MPGSGALNVVMATIAWSLPAEPSRAHEGHHAAGRLVEWRVLILSFSLFLYSFGYGGITSFAALYADANGVKPKGIYLTALAVVILVTRPISGKLGDRYRLPARVPAVPGADHDWAVAAHRRRIARMAAGVSATIFGVGFGTAYPTFAGYVMRQVGPARRGAAFGAILGVLRHRHRHGLDEYRLAHPALRLFARVRHGDGAVGPGPALLCGRRSTAAEKSGQGARGRVIGLGLQKTVRQA